MRTKFQSDPELYREYYSQQVGHGLPYFAGASHQRGHGLGAILGGLARAALPALKQLAVPLVKRGTKALANAALSAGANVIQDVLTRNQNPVKSLKKRVKQGLVNTVHQTLIPPPGEPSKGIRKRRVRRPVHSSKVKRRRTNDIFD